MMPRWLTPGLLARLGEIDEEFWRDRRNGPLVIEVIHRGGRPQMARVRDYFQAPILVEMTISTATS